MKSRISVSILLCLLSVGRVQAEGGFSFREWLKRDRNAMEAWQKGQAGREIDRTGTESTNGVESVESGFVSAPPEWGVASVHYGYTPRLAAQEAGSVFSLARGPATMLINTNTGELSWMPTLDDVGSVDIELVAESESTTNHQAYSVQVTRLVQAGQGTIGADGGVFKAEHVSFTMAEGATERPIDITVHTVEKDLPADFIPGTKLLGPIQSIQVQAADGGGLRKDDLKKLKATFHYDPSLLPAGASEEHIKLAGFDPANPGELHILDAQRLVSRPGAAAVAGGVTLVAALVPPMIVVLWEGGELVSQFLRYTEVYKDDYVQVFYKDSILPNTTMAAARTYGESIAKSIKAAKPIAEKLGFTASVPGSVEVMVAPSTSSESGSYCSFNELIYIKPGLRGTSMTTSPPHEFFHAIQDDFYLMGSVAAASAMGATSDVYWWTEASAVWFGSLLFPGVQDDYIKGVLSVPGSGYLRCPLNSTIQAAAYSKASFAQYATSRKKSFVLDVMNGSSKATQVMTAINGILPLNEHYKYYVNWALDKYGARDSDDVRIFLTEDPAAMTCSKKYTKPSAPKVNVVHIGAESNIVSEVIADSAAGTPYMAFVHRLHAQALNPASMSATTKAIDVKFERTGGAAHDVPFVLVRPKGGPGPMLKSELVPGADWVRFHDIGQDAVDKYDLAYLVYTDTSTDSSGQYKWHVQVRDLDRLMGPWTGGLPQLTPVGRGRTPSAGIRLNEIKINGTSYRDYGEFEEWAKQWITAEITQDEDESEEGLVSDILGSIFDGISAEIMLFVIPAMKAGFDGIPFALAAECPSEGHYLPFMPGLPEEELQKLRTDPKRPPLKRNGRALSGTWEMGEEDDDGKQTIEWSLTLTEDPSVIDCSIRFVASGLEPDNDEPHAIHSFELLAKGQLRYQDLPHGESVYQQKHADTVKALFMKQLMGAKLETDAVFRPMIEALLEQQQESQQASSPPPA